MSRLSLFDLTMYKGAFKYLKRIKRAYLSPSGTKKKNQQPTTRSHNFKKNDQPQPYDNYFPNDDRNIFDLQHSEINKHTKVINYRFLKIKKSKEKKGK